jgi:hypothetical protein
LKTKYDAEAQLNVVALDGVECSAEAVADACHESGAVHEDGRLHVQFPANEPEFLSFNELLKRLLDGRNF